MNDFEDLGHTFVIWVCLTIVAVLAVIGLASVVTEILS